jgi:hypothetical protein
MGEIFMANKNFKLFSICVIVATFASSSAFAERLIPELFCTIADAGQNLNCQYKDKRDSTRAFGDQDIIAFIDKAMDGAFMTVRSKRGFERTFEVDPGSAPFKNLRDARKSEGVSNLARIKLDLFSELEKKAIQISDGLDTVFVQTDLLKYDPAVANDKCKMDMKLFTSGATYEKNLETLTAENKALAIYLTSLIKAFKEPGSCLDDYKVEVAQDGSVELSQLQGLSQAFKNRCKKK